MYKLIRYLFYLLTGGIILLLLETGHCENSIRLLLGLIIQQFKKR